MRHVIGAALVLAVLALGAWSQDAGDKALGTSSRGGYSTISVKADVIKGGLDGTIKRLEGNAHVTLLPSDPDGERLPISADKVTFAYPKDGGDMPSRIILEGNVVIEHPKGTFKAGRGDWNLDTEQLRFTENPIMDMPQIRGFRGKEILLDFKENDFTVMGGEVDEIDLNPPQEGSAKGATPSKPGADQQ